MKIIERQQTLTMYNMEANRIGKVIFIPDYAVCGFNTLQVGDYIIGTSLGDYINLTRNKVYKQDVIKDNPAIKEINIVYINQVTLKENQTLIKRDHIYPKDMYIGQFGTIIDTIYTGVIVYKVNDELLLGFNKKTKQIMTWSSCSDAILKIKPFEPDQTFEWING